MPTTLRVKLKRAVINPIEYAGRSKNYGIADSRAARPDQSDAENRGVRPTAQEKSRGQDFAVEAWRGLRGFRGRPKARGKVTPLENA